jgi:hypothetical protein
MLLLSNTDQKSRIYYILALGGQGPDGTDPRPYAFELRASWG